MITLETSAVSRKRDFNWLSKWLERVKARHLCTSRMEGAQVRLYEINGQRVYITINTAADRWDIHVSASASLDDERHVDAAAEALGVVGCRGL